MDYTFSGDGGVYTALMRFNAVYLLFFEILLVQNICLFVDILFYVAVYMCT